MFRGRLLCAISALSLLSSTSAMPLLSSLAGLFSRTTENPKGIWGNELCHCQLHDLTLLNNTDKIGLITNIPFLPVDRPVEPGYVARDTCEGQCIEKFEICDRRYCCPTEIFDEMSQDKHTGKNFLKWENEALYEDRCRHKYIGREMCDEDESLVCFWQDLEKDMDNNGRTKSIMWKPTGGDITNFWIPNKS